VPDNRILKIYLLSTFYKISLFHSVVCGVNLNHLFLFRAVAEAGGFSRAAERVHVSQPAISMQVGELEAQLGLSLFHRLGRGVKLTAAGQLLLGYAQRLGALATEAEQAMAEMKGLRRGHLAIGASTTIGVYLLPNLLGEYRRRYPDIDLRFDIANTEDIQRRLVDGTLDAGLTEGLPPDCHEIETVVFLRDRLVPIAQPDHPRLKADGKPLTLQQLCAEPMIVRETGSGTRDVIDHALAKRGQKLQRLPLVLGSTEAIKRAVAAGLGVAIVSHLTIQTELAAGQLAILPLRGFQLTRPLHRLCWRNRARDPATLAFLALLDQRYPPTVESERCVTHKR
jgi:DNA-binding transcriptional LysR family regulator